MCAYKRRSPQPVVEGGTGLSSITAHDLIVGNGTGTPGLVAPSATSGVPLISQGAASDPAYGTAVVAGGGTGVTSNTAYAVLCGGTTSTNPIQSIASVGTSGQVLTSNGAGALPTFQAASGGSQIIMGANNGGQTSNTASARFSSFSGSSSTNTASGVAYICPSNGVVDRLYVLATVVGSTTNDTITLTQNGSATALTVTITATTTGTYTDLVNTVSVSAGDTLYWTLSQATTSGNTYFISCRFIPS